MKKLFIILVVLLTGSIAQAKPAEMRMRHLWEDMELHYQMKREIKVVRHKCKIMSMTAYNKNRATRVRYRGIRLHRAKRRHTRQSILAL